ncbi:MAG: hypothetical protein IIZ61_09085 [Lachnospiraceae bacterium]|nr:hypothetical protein [Lachnospiraceae bacterium]
MGKLKDLLLKVDGSYYDFVVAMLSFAKKSDYREKRLEEYLLDNPLATTSDVILYTSTELDLLSDNVSGNANTAIA